MADDRFAQPFFGAGTWLPPPEELQQLQLQQQQQQQQGDAAMAEADASDEEMSDADSDADADAAHAAPLLLPAHLQVGHQLLDICCCVACSLRCCWGPPEALHPSPQKINV